MQVPDTPPREAASISGAVGAVRNVATIKAEAAAMAWGGRARKIKASLPLPWITVIAPR